MKKRLVLLVSLIFVFCCFLAVTVNAAQCQGGCTDNWILTEGKLGYLGSIYAANVCPDCGTVNAEETIEPMFVTNGYSYNEASGGITQHFAVNKVAVNRYEEITGKTVQYGAIIAAEEVLSEVVGNGSPIDLEGKPVDERIFATNFTKTDRVVFDVMINNIPNDARLGVGLVCSAYVIVDDVISYIDDGKKEEKAVANTYYDIVKTASSWDDVKENENGSTLKVLTIGNSFSDDAMEYVYNIAKAAGVEHVELANLRIGNCSLATHVSNALNDNGVYMFRHWADGATKWADTGTWEKGGPYTIKQAVEFADWDYIVFQQVSDQSNKASTYDDLSTLINYVEPLCPTAKLAWHMTWSKNTYYSQSGPSYAGIVEAVNAKITSNRKIDVIIPAGTAIENAKTSYLTEFQIQRDLKHLSYGMGRYIAGLTFVKALTGLSIDDIDYPTADTENHYLIDPTVQTSEKWKLSFQFTDEINAICIESANNAIDNPFQVTNSEYPTKN